MTVVTKSAEETKALGRRIGRLLNVGDVVLLIGGLGAGKTTLVQGLVRALGIKEALSPTFVLAQTFHGRLPVHHLDCYRLTPKVLLNRGLHNYLSGGGEIPPGVVLIEWADRWKEIWPQDRLEVRIGILSRSTRRRISVRGAGKRYRELSKLLGD